MKFGTAYYPDYYPAADWTNDLERLKAAGIDCVRILEFGWAWYQPEPDRWQWEGLDRFLDLAVKWGIEVCLSTPTATPPPWFFEKYPDAYLTDAQGNPCRSPRHMTCWNHPAAVQEAFQTIRRLAQRYGTHPAVWGWQIDNEPNYAEDVNAFYDFNPHALREAQKWLRHRYGSLDALNKAWFGCFWSQTYNRWEQIWRTHHPKANPGAFLNFLQWREENLARFVQDQARILRENTVAQKIGVNIPETGLPSSLILGQDYWAQTRGLDWIGSDLYTASGNRERDYQSIRYSCDLMRSVRDSAAPDAEFLLSETQGGPHLRAWECDFAAETWEPDLLRESLRLFAERGATQSWLFMWRPTPGGKEMGMNGLQTLEGENTERTEAVRQIAAEESFGEAEARSYRERSVALVHYSQLSFRFLLYFENSSRMYRLIRGAHELLDREGFQVRFVTDEEILSGLPPAQRLVLPLSPVLDSKAQEAVMAWHRERAGRQLWLGPDTAMISSEGQLLPASARPLWSWMKVEPGFLVDRGESLRIDGRLFARFRILHPQAEAKILTSGKWGARTLPAHVTRAEGTLLHAYDWTDLDELPHGAQCLPG